MRINPLIITVAGMGAELTKKDTPYLPVTPDEIVAEANRVFVLGATVFHLHVRDEEGVPTLNLNRIIKIITEIKQKTDLIIQLSTGGAIGDTMEGRLKTLDADVNMGSLTLGSVNFGEEVFLNPYPLIEDLARKMLKKNIKPELEIFDVSMVETAHRLIGKGLLCPPLHFNVILGGPGWLPATVENLEFILGKLPRDSTWSASGVGRAQLPMIEYAITHGGHVRTGLEDNIYLSKGVLAKGNSDLVSQALDLAQRHGRRIASPKEARKILGIEAREKR